MKNSNNKNMIIDQELEDLYLQIKKLIVKNIIIENENKREE